MQIQSYPHIRINVEDNSIYVPTPSTDLPLHRPLYIMKAQKGVVNQPVWYPTYNEAVAALGEETFNNLNSTYFSREAAYLLRTFPFNGAFICRVADAAAKKSGIVIEAWVEQMSIPHYQKDLYGVRVLDENGDPISIGTLAGLSITWVKRAIATDETTFAPVTTTSSRGNPVTKYPMFVFYTTSPGAWGNDIGFSFSYDTVANPADMVERCGGVFYTFAPVQKKYAESTVKAVGDKYGMTQNSFIIKPNVVDPSTTAPVSMDDVIRIAYDGGKLPFSGYAFPANFKTVGDLVIAKAAALNLSDSIDSAVKDGYGINIVSGKDLNGNYYDMFVVATANTDVTGDNSIALMKSTTNHFLVSGTDGDVTDAAIEARMVQFLEVSADMNPDIVDASRYPFNYLFDTGYALETKYQMLEFMSVREDVRVVLATQIASNSPNSKFVDESTGGTLRSRALLQRESVAKGTECCRADIFMQCGILNGDNSNRYLPATIWSAIKHAEYQNRDFLNQEPAGLPNSIIDVFREINWVPAAEETKSRFWNTGLNYCQYYSMTGLHYPAVRTVYNYDTSVLVNSTFVDAIVYAKQVCRVTWHEFVGRSDPFALLADAITKKLDKELTRVFGGKYTFKTSVYQTEEEAKLGYALHILIDITSPATTRVWSVDLKVNRENYEG